VTRPSIRTLLVDDEVDAAAAAPAASRPGAASGWAALLQRAVAGTVALWLGAAQALAAGSGRPESSVVNHADTSRLPPGISHWIADVYNESLWLYGLIVVVVMAGMGLILGLLTDRFMAMLGVDLGRTPRHE
jgi:hypothetical protein